MKADEKGTKAGEKEAKGGEKVAQIALAAFAPMSHLVKLSLPDNSHF